MTDLNSMLIIGALAFGFVQIMNTFESRNWPSERATTLFGAIRELLLRRDA